MSLPEPRIQTLTIEALLKALGIVRGPGVAFDLSPVVIATIDISRLIPGLPAPVSPVLSAVDLPAASPTITDRGDIYSFNDSITTGALISAQMVMDWGLFNQPVTQIDLLACTFISSVAVANFAVAPFRGSGIVGINFPVSLRTGAPANTIQFRENISAGAPQLTIVSPFVQFNVPANTLITYPYGSPPISIQAPFGVGDGFIMESRLAVAGAQTVSFWALLRIRGFAT